MQRASPSRLAPVGTGIVYCVIGLALAAGGVWLGILGGSLYYVIAGLGILVTGALLVAGRRSALCVYAAVLIGTLVWAIGEIGFDWWPLAERGDVVFPLGVWLLTPWITRNLGHGAPSSRKAMSLPLWGGVVASVVVLILGLSSTYHEIDGTIGPVASGAPLQDSAGQPDEDWRSCGRTQFGQRYSPLAEITPANVKDLKIAWVFRTGDLPDKNDPGETTFEVTPIKVRDTLYRQRRCGCPTSVARDRATARRPDRDRQADPSRAHRCERQALGDSGGQERCVGVGLLRIMFG